MSVQAITGALSIKDVSPSEKLLLIVLSNYADEEGKCWPSQSRLARDTCMSKRTIIRLFATLELKGLLSRKARFRKNARTTDMILLTFGGGDTVSLGVVTSTTKGGDTVSHRTIIEESKSEPSALASALGWEDHARQLKDKRRVQAMWKELAAQTRTTRRIR